MMIEVVLIMAAMDEVNFWRRENGLPEVRENVQYTEFAQMKAEYRAARLLKDGHDGPRPPAGSREGTGEATRDWGWLTCIMEETADEAGAGVAIGRDGQRYMVLIMRGGGDAPKGRAIGGPGSRLRIIDTSHLTPDAPLVVGDLGVASDGR